MRISEGKLRLLCKQNQVMDSRRYLVRSFDNIGFQSLFQDQMTEEQAMMVILPRIENNLCGLKVALRSLQPVLDLLPGVHLKSMI